MFLIHPVELASIKPGPSSSPSFFLFHLLFCLCISFICSFYGRPPFSLPPHVGLLPLSHHCPLLFLPSSCSHGYPMTLSIFRIVRGFHLISLGTVTTPPPLQSVKFSSFTFIFAFAFPHLPPFFPLYLQKMTAKREAVRQVVMATANRLPQGTEQVRRER